MRLESLGNIHLFHNDPFRLYQQRNLSNPQPFSLSQKLLGHTDPSPSSRLTMSANPTPVPSPWTSLQTDPELYNMALTTTYTQPPQCTDEAITQMAWHGPNLWENAIHPVAESVITTCYPSQFYSSVMGAINSVALPAFSALVCPDKWVTWNYNTTYIVCCPKYGKSFVLRIYAYFETMLTTVL